MEDSVFKSANSRIENEEVKIKTEWDKVFCGTVTDTIDAVHRKSELNKKFDRRNLKQNYLLSKVIYCGECGLCMFDQANRKERWYYRHSRNGDGTCSHKSWSIPATIVDEAVLYQIYGLMGDKQKVEHAVTRAVINISMRKKIEKDNEALAINLKAVKAKRVNLVIVGSGYRPLPGSIKFA